MDHAWARRVRDQCVPAGIPFFFKQSASRRTEVGTALVEADGSRTVWHQYPGELEPAVACRGKREPWFAFGAAAAAARG